MLENSRKPQWFRENIQRLAVGEAASEVLRTIRENRLATVCTSAACPNKGVCFAEGTATFMILGDVCTRACRFCNISTGKPEPTDYDEPRRLADAALALKLRFVVVTSVCRDDLPDEGASAFAMTIAALKERIPKVKVEVLTPDFSGRDDCLQTVLDAGPDVFNHNLETVRRLTPRLRAKARYDRSLGVLARARELAPEIPTKSGLMVGLGETRDELRETFAELAKAGVSRLTIGQYLQPSRLHHPVARYYEPGEFDELRLEAKAAGIGAVLAGPLVRSSYHAGAFT
ncbi:MAG: lipoyl synthase [Acidobacteria bacterium]|nr:lipoyl synthase [Acidobacteriota bacterium]